MASAGVRFDLPSVQGHVPKRGVGDWRRGASQSVATQDIPDTAPPQDILPGMAGSSTPVASADRSGVSCLMSSTERESAIVPVFAHDGGIPFIRGAPMSVSA